MKCPPLTVPQHPRPPSRLFRGLTGLWKKTKSKIPVVDTLIIVLVVVVVVVVEVVMILLFRPAFRNLDFKTFRLVFLHTNQVRAQRAVVLLGHACIYTAEDDDENTDRTMGIAGINHVLRCSSDKH